MENGTAERKQYKKTCKICGKEYMTVARHSTLCSKECKKIHQKQRKEAKSKVVAEVA